MENKRAQIILRRRARLEPEGLLADRNTQRKIGKRAKILMLAWPGWCPLVGCSFSGMIAAIGSVGLVDQAAAAGSPTISSSRKGASVSSVMELARRSANSSFHSSGMAPMRRTLASSFCKMLTTSKAAAMKAAPARSLLPSCPPPPRARPFTGAGGGNRTLTGLPPTDFRTIYGFRRLAWRVRALARLWSGLSLHRSVRRALSFALGAAHLVSTPSRVRGLGSGLPHERFPRI
jgi:hypothetical protein